MTYQISYFSPQGHAKELAYSFRKLLPSRTPIMDLSEKCSTDGMVHLVGFEYANEALDEVPKPVQRFLDQLEGKDILLFATCPFCVDGQMQEQLDRSMLARIPSNAKYHGLYLCQGEVHLTVLEDTIKLAVQQNNTEAKNLLRQYRKGRGHPNREDVRKGYRFISSSIPLDTY